MYCRWYLQENQSGETAEIPSSVETFDRFYPNGEPAIGPVATPIPDDSYIPQPSSISNVNPNDPITGGPSDIWIVTRGSDNQYISSWLPDQIPLQQVVEVVNQDTNSPVATDSVKSISTTIPLPSDAPVKTQLTSGPPTNIVQQIWVRAPSVFGSQKVISDPTTTVQNVQSIKQIVDMPAPSAKQVVQQQITKAPIPVPPPPVAPIVSKTTFTVPPPPPPPIKGTDKTATVLSAGPAPDSNILIADKNAAVQQVRYIWIPTSAKTGRFITVPVSNVNIDKATIDKGMPLRSTPISMSDTWILKQDGSAPSFEQQKTIVSPTAVQNGKVIVQNPPVVQIDSSANPPVVTKADLPPFPPTLGKTSGPPVDIWPARKDGTNEKVLTKSPVVPVSDKTLPSPKSGTIVVSKSFPVPPPVAPVISPRTFVLNSKVIPPAPAVSVSKGKPCPLPLPKSSLNPPNQNLFTVPRFVLTRSQPRPLTRIVRVNRYPSGTYYLLNTGIRPNFYSYPSPAIIQQPKSRLVRVLQTKQFPIPVQSKQPIYQTKQISIPVQSKVIPPPVLPKNVPFPISSRKIFLPLSSPVTQTRILYPSAQAIKYAYPLNSYLNASPIPGKRVFLPQISSLKLASPGSSSGSSSSESSSESDSSESSEEKKEKKEKSETSESKDNKELEKESEAKSGEIEKESDETSVESQSKESIEAAESQISTQTVENTAVLTAEDSLKVESKPYMFGFGVRDNNGTVQHRQEVSDLEGRVTGSYGYQDPSGTYRIANYVADSDGFRVNVESNEPGTVTHESAFANFISNKATDNEKFQTEGSSGTAANIDQRD